MLATTTVTSGKSAAGPLTLHSLLLMIDTGLVWIKRILTLHRSHFSKVTCKLKVTSIQNSPREYFPFPPNFHLLGFVLMIL